MNPTKILLIALPVLLIGVLAFVFWGGEDDAGGASGTPMLARTSEEITKDTTLKVIPRTSTITVKPEKVAPTPVRAKHMTPATISVSGVVSDEEGPLPDAWVIVVDGKDMTHVLASARTGDEESPLGIGRYEINGLYLDANAQIFMLAEGFASMAKEIIPTGGEMMRSEYFQTKTASAVNVSVKTTPRGEAIANAKVQIIEDPLTSIIARHYYSQFIYDPSAFTKAGDAVVTPDRAVWQPIRETITNRDGQVYFGGLSKGRHQFAATHDTFVGVGALAAKESLSIGEGEDRELTISMRLLAQYSGIVVENVEAATPIANARIELLDEELKLLESISSDAEGVFKFSKPQALATRMKVSNPGFASEFVNLMQVDDPNLGQIRLDKAATLNGIVVDEFDAPIGGATVFLNQGMIESGVSGFVGIKQAKRDHTTTTDGGGRFSFSDLGIAQRGGGGIANIMRGIGGGGGMTVVATASGFSPSTETVPALDINEAKEVRIKLMRAGVVRGVVVNQNGMPVAGATVGGTGAGNEIQVMGFKAVFAPGAPADGAAGIAQTMMKGMLGDIEFTVTSDSAGRFEFKDLAPGGYLFGAKHPDYESVFESNVTVKSGTETPLKLVLAYSSALFGVYYDENGRPTSGKELTLSSLSAMPPLMLATTTDASGRYRYDGLAPGSYRLVAGSVGSDLREMGRLFEMRNVSLEIKGGEQREYNFYEVNPDSTTLIVRATLNGEPYTGTIGLGGGGFAGLTIKNAQVSEDGTHVFKGLALGSYSLSRSGGSGLFGGLLRSERVRVKDKPEQRVEIAFKSVNIYGTVRTSSGAPLPADVIVFATPYRGKATTSDTSIVDQVSAQAADQVKVDENGSFEIKDIAPDTYTFTARSATAGFIRTAPIRAESEIRGLVLALEDGVGAVKALVKNYVGTSEGSLAGMLLPNASFVIEDANGEVVNLGKTSGGRMTISDSSARLQASEDGTASVTKEGLPVGTWTITLQVSNYGPVTVRDVKIIKDQTTEIVFELQPAGHLEIQFLNDDMDPSGVQDLRYTIRDSKNQVYERRFSAMDFIRTMMNPLDTSKKNTFVLSDLPPDSYTIEINYPGYQASKSSFTIKSKETTALPITLIEE